MTLGLETAAAVDMTQGALIGEGRAQQWAKDKRPADLLVAIWWECSSAIAV
jgi:hypothetical protein